ncbi:MAG: Holliday junction branch migration protein RuvA [Pseudomonadota bacterium]
MIGKVTGRVDYIASDHALIEAGGIGYVIHCAPGTLSALPAPGGMAALYTELLVREDLMQLIGFRTLAEREWHRLLTSVQGVGAKVALAILDALGPDGVSRALALGDAAAIKAAPGVGPKLANRITHELADKAAGVMALGAQAARVAAPSAAPETSLTASAPSTPAPSQDGADPRATADALSALVNLGYDRAEAARAVAGTSQAGETATEGLIRAALRTLMPGAS